ncbi:MAG: hypothetical protein FWF35_03625 [Elusimicrobia bacterium]|nr:hypothetical protein [Elusimicrobiota bacterium]
MKKLLLSIGNVYLFSVNIISKKILFLLLLFIPFSAANGTDFTALGKQLIEEHKEKSFLVVYKKDSKTLIYLVANHGDENNKNLVNYVFNNKLFPPPQVVVVEWERKDRDFEYPSTAEANIAAFFAWNHNIPIVRADLATDDWFEVLKNKYGYIYRDFQGFIIIRSMFAEDAAYKDRKTPEYWLNDTQRFYNPKYGDRLTPESFLEWFKEAFNGEEFYKIDFSKYPNPYDYDGPFMSNRMSLRVSQSGREPFMRENIKAAIEKYDVVYVGTGGLHYIANMQMLQEIFGEPNKIIQDISSVKLPPLPKAEDKEGQAIKLDLVDFDNFINNLK